MKWERLIEARAHAGLTQPKLGKLMDVTKMTVLRWEALESSRTYISKRNSRTYCITASTDFFTTSRSSYTKNNIWMICMISRRRCCYRNRKTAINTLRGASLRTRSAWSAISPRKPTGRRVWSGPRSVKLFAEWRL